MSGLLRPGLLLATIAGLAVAVWTFGEAGLGDVLAIAGRMGAGGFLLYCLYSMPVFAILGAAWLAVAREEGWGRIGLFTWGRLLREAASDLLPFSQIGGLIISTRMMTAAGVVRWRVYASQIADTTTELASQLIFTLYGVGVAAAILLGDDRAAALRWPAFIALTALVAIVAALIAAQRWMLPIANAIGGRLMPGVIGAGGEIDTELRAIYARRRMVLASFLLNLLGWVASATGAWIVLRLMGIAAPLWVVLAIESLIATLRSVAFAVPGGIGVQEAGYALVGPLLGLPIESALALALAKRARDLAIAVPIMILWQIGEARAVARRTA